MFPAKRSTKLAFTDITELKNLTDGHGLLRATDREVSLINMATPDLVLPQALMKVEVHPAVLQTLKECLITDDIEKIKSILQC
jgi:hypothetical protein